MAIRQCPQDGQRIESEESTVCEKCGYDIRDLLVPADYIAKWQSQAAEAESMGQTAPPFVASSILGSIWITPDRVLVRKFTLFSHRVAQELETPLSNVTGVELDMPGTIKDGIFTLHFVGRSKSGLDDFSAVGLGGFFVGGHSNENTLNFTKKDEPVFRFARELIDQYRSEPKPNTPTGSYLDELERLAELRDKGIITEADFEARKSQILGL